MPAPAKKRKATDEVDEDLERAAAMEDMEAMMDEEPDWDAEEMDCGDEVAESTFAAQLSRSVAFKFTNDLDLYTLQSLQNGLQALWRRVPLVPSRFRPCCPRPQEGRPRLPADRDRPLHWSSRAWNARSSKRSRSRHEDVWGHQKGQLRKRSNRIFRTRSI